MGFGINVVLLVMHETRRHLGPRTGPILSKTTRDSKNLKTPSLVKQRPPQKASLPQILVLD